MKSIEGKAIVITGANSGLGKETAKHLSESGATVALGARRVGCIQALAGGLTKRRRAAFKFPSPATQADAYGPVPFLPHNPL